MENQIQKYGSETSFENLMVMAKNFAESGMFPDMQKAAQCIVKIQAGQEIGIPPFAAMTGIHIIQGRPTIGAGLIAARVKGSGKYDYRVMQMSDKACSIDFYQGAQKIGNSTFTIEDAKKAQTKNIDKFPKNMLFARAISNGVKWYCPDVFAGPVYTPEEIEDIQHEVITTTIPISVDPSPVPMTSNDTLYRTATNDTDLIVKLIDEATDNALLRTFHTVNNKFFKSNPELAQRLINKGVSLKPLAKTEVNNKEKEPA